MNTINASIQKAYTVLEGNQLIPELANQLANIKRVDILDLVSLANKVQSKFAPKAHVCTILNAKSGQCGEDCRFCAQSGHNNADVDVYPLISKDEILKRAEAAYETGIRSFGIVTSGTGFKKRTNTFTEILKAIDLIHNKLPELNVCASLGILSEETTRDLADRNIIHYNINLQTEPSRYRELISTTHKIDERIETIKLLQKYKIKVCCGGILGIGENMLDRIKMAYALNDLDVDVIPLNILVPIKGTPLEEQAHVSVSEAAIAFSLFRLINPTKTIKFAAGRETIMKDFQGLLMLAGANGMLTGGYLTTRGRDVPEDISFMKELDGFASKAGIANPLKTT